MTEDNLTLRIKAHLLEKVCRVFPPAPDLGAPETVHRMRVASRRLRVGLEFFAAIYDPRELKQILQQLRRLTRVLGAIRVLDVNLDRLRKAAAHLPPGASEARVALQRQWKRERGERCAEATGLIRASDISKFASRIESLIARSQRYLTSKRLLQIPDGALTDLRRTTRKRLRQFDEQRGDELFHRLRIATKKYRYGLEIARAVFDADVGSRLEGAETLQGLMGDCHDAEVMLDCIRTARKKWSDNDKHLARDARRLIDSFEDEHNRHHNRVKKFMRGNQRWLKRVILKPSVLIPAR